MGSSNRKNSVQIGTPPRPDAGLRKLPDEKTSHAAPHLVSIYDRVTIATCTLIFGLALAGAMAWLRETVISDAGRMSVSVAVMVMLGFTVFNTVSTVFGRRDRVSETEAATPNFFETCLTAAESCKAASTPASRLPRAHATPSKVALMSTDSIQAVQACMLFLKLRLDKHSHAPIQCGFSKHGGSSGTMFVTFQNDVHAHNGPYLTFDDTMYGFGIRRKEFKPYNHRFKFNAKSRSLTCKGTGYTFELTF